MDIKSIYRITAVNLTHNSLPHLCFAVILALATPVVFGISSLDKIQSAQPLEKFLSITGIILLTPIFLPEHNENIRDLIRSKKFNHSAICIIRLIYSILMLAVIFAVFTYIMRKNESAVTINHFFGGFASALFLGSLGFTIAGSCNNTIVGYMVSFLYYLVNFFMKKQLGYFYLFSMSNGDFKYKYIIFSTAIFLFITALFINSQKSKIYT